MSLISARNFAQPFQNKVHLVTIVIVVMIFAVLRLSGGSIQTQNAPKERFERAAPTRSNAAPDQYLRELDAIEEEATQNSWRPIPERSSDPENSTSRQGEQPTTNTPRGRDGGLDAIERSLGLR